MKKETLAASLFFVSAGQAVSDAHRAGQEHVVEHGEGCHGLDDGDGAGQHAGVVAAAGMHRGGTAGGVDGGLVAQEGGDGLEGYAEVDVLAVADAALYAAAVVGAGVDAAVGAGIEFVVELAATLFGAGKACSILEAFGGVDGEHGGAEVGVELGKDGGAQAGRAAAYEAGDDAAHGVAAAFHVGYEAGHGFGCLGVGAAHGVGFGEREVVAPIVGREGDGAHLRGVGRYADAQRAQGELGQGASHAARHRFAGRRAAAAAVVAQAVAGLVGIVGMRGAEYVAQVVVVGRVLVLIAHDETDGAAGGAAFEYAREYFHAVGLAARGGQGALSRPAAGQFGTDEIHVDGNAGGKAVDDAAKGGAVALAKGGEAQDVAKGVHASAAVMGQ